MKGYALDSFPDCLTKVADEHSAKPLKSFDILAALGPKVETALRGYWGGDFEINRAVRDLSAEHVIKLLTVDQLCKFKYSQDIMMSDSVETLFKTTMPFNIIRKVESSMWRWGCGDKSWNEVVDAYNGLRHFSIPVDGFEVRLDFTNGWNERGYSQSSRTFLDGVFGFLVYYKGEHVMTLGFSVARDRRVLVQQVQLTKRKGNRFLFKLPANRVEFFLECFAAAFPAHTICIADGADIAKTNINSYKQGLTEMKARKERGHTWAEDAENEAHLKAKVKHLKADLPRIAAMYAETGKFKRGEDFKTNGITHYKLAA